MTRSQSVLTTCARSSHDVFLFVPHLDILPELLQFICSSIRSEDSCRHSGELSDGVCLLTSLKLEIVYIEFSVCFLQQRNPPSSIFWRLGGEWSSTPGDSESIIDVEGLSLALVEHIELEYSGWAETLVDENALDSLWVLSDCGSSGEKPAVSNATLGSTIR